MANLLSTQLCKCCKDTFHYNNMGEGKEGTEEGEKVEMGEEEEGKDLLPLHQHYYI